MFMHALRQIGNIEAVARAHADDSKKHLNYLADRHVCVTAQRDAIESFLKDA